MEKGALFNPLVISLSQLERLFTNTRNIVEIYISNQILTFFLELVDTALMNYRYERNGMSIYVYDELAKIRLEKTVDTAEEYLEANCSAFTSNSTGEPSLSVLYPFI